MNLRETRPNSIEPENRDHNKRVSRATYPVDQNTPATIDEDAFVQPSYLVVDYDEASMRVYSDFIKGKQTAKFTSNRRNSQKTRKQK